MNNSRNALRSSCSENGKYPEFCDLAAHNPSVFRSFRSHSSYTSVVETVSKVAGQDYLRLALKQVPALSQNLSTFALNDSVGGPQTYPYRAKLLGPRLFFAPTTLRYIKVLSDLTTLFGSLDGFRVIEIGGGYGGLCRLVSKYYKLESYILVDLPPCLQLSKVFLGQLKVPRVEYMVAEDLKLDQQYDLVISNYAFSELSREYQNLYAETILMRSTRGYLTCNFETHTWDSQQMNEVDLQNLIKTVEIYESSPPLGKIDVECSVKLLTWKEVSARSG
jgi:putative sugar O-methyltransferase